MISAPASSLSAPMSHALSGMQSGVARLNQAAETVAAGKVDVEPMIDMIVAEQTVKQNAAVIRTADEMHGTLLDILV